MKPELYFTQAGRVFNFSFYGKSIACNYYFTRTNLNSPNQKLWMNVLFYLEERKDVYEMTWEQPESALLVKPKKAMDDKVQKMVETYLLTMY